MPRAGRSLELLVKALEQLLAGAPVEIQSPDLLWAGTPGLRVKWTCPCGPKLAQSVSLSSLNAGTAQSPRTSPGSSSSLPSGKTWAQTKPWPCSRGFSAGARNLARSKQVDLRSLEELEPHVVYDWLTDQTLDHRTRHVDVVGASFHLGEQPTEIDPATLASILEKISALRIPEEGLHQDSKVFAHKTDLTLVSVDEILIDAGLRCPVRRDVRRASWQREAHRLDHRLRRSTRNSRSRLTPACSTWSR